MNNPTFQPISISLFEHLREEIGDRIPVLRFTKPTLVHFSHTLEDVVLSNRLPALMFTGFQESSYWKQETERYRQLAGIAKQVCIFAGKPLPEDSTAGAVQITLEEGDPLRQEWFVLILSASFSVVLAGRDRAAAVENERHRQFDTIVSFEPAIINQVLDLLEGVLNHYRPDLLTTLRENRARYSVPEVDVNLVTNIMTEIMIYEENLVVNLDLARQQQEAINDALIQERDFSRNLVEGGPAYLIVTHADNNIVVINPALREILNDIPEGIDAETLWQSITPAEDQALVFLQIAVMLREQTPVMWQSHLLCADGQRRLIEWRTRFVPQARGDDLLLFMGIDVTDREAADQLRREQEKLKVELDAERRFNELRDRLLYTVSHEFRTPLAIIQTSSQMLAHYFSRMDEAARLRRIDIMRRQIKHLEDMLDDMAIVLQNRNGKLVFNPAPIDPVTQARRIFSSTRDTYGSQHEAVFVNHWPWDDIVADERLFQQIIANLLVNAFKYSPQDTTVTLTLSENAGWFQMTVSDQGIGIPPEDQKHIYEAFYRGQNVGARGGTGLGLNIVYECVRLHGGEIDFKSDSETGTTFKVRLPREREA